jgi:hypothetical protein
MEVTQGLEILAADTIQLHATKHCYVVDTILGSDNLSVGRTTVVMYVISSVENEAIF